MLNKIIRFSISNKIVIGMMTLALIIWGLWSASKIAVDALPDVTNNQVQVSTNAPTLAAQEVEQFITYPVKSRWLTYRDWWKYVLFHGLV